MQLAPSSLHSCSPSSLDPPGPSCPQPEVRPAKALQPHTSKVERKRKTTKAACCRNTWTESHPLKLPNPSCMLAVSSHSPQTQGCEGICTWPSAQGAIHPIVTGRANRSSQDLPRAHVLPSRQHKSRQVSPSSPCFRFLTGDLSCTTNIAEVKTGSCLHAHSQHLELSCSQPP